MPDLRQPVWLALDEVPPLPAGWTALPTAEACIQLKPGKLFDSKTVSPAGHVPVLNQSESGTIGFHNESPGIQASPSRPVVTFANHTCAVRLMKKPFSVIQNIFPKVGKPGLTDTEYFYYASLGRVSLTDYKGHHPTFRQAYVPIPPLPIQRRIAGILSAYDDLIENSQRRIKILESMARALYREWFVHFRFPGHESFPRVPSSLGEIPEGWEVKRLDELASIRGGKQLEKGDIHPTGEFPVFGGNGIQGYSKVATHEGFVIAFGRVGAYCGAIHWSYSGAWLNNNSSSIVPLNYNELVLHYLLGFNFESLRGGAAQPFISNTALAGAQFAFPGDVLAAQFCELAKPFRLQLAKIEQSTQNLRCTRDLLLPRLLSGQVALDELKVP
jgi:restriction endonuclease S subunit